LFGLAWIQLNKRSIINFRLLLGVPKKRNPKGVALFVMGLLEDYKRTNDITFLNQAIELGDWLLTQQSDQKEWQHPCWGYHFDWNARAFFVPKGTPNVITTIYVAQALFSLSEVTGESKYRNPALDCAHFIVKSLYREFDGRQFFAYIPDEDAFVHNASLWGPAWVAKVVSLTNNDEYKELSFNAAR
jgi:rhamnogalacturonyl hydrolase YesR